MKFFSETFLKLFFCSVAFLGPLLLTIDISSSFAFGILISALSIIFIGLINLNTIQISKPSFNVSLILLFILIHFIFSSFFFPLYKDYFRFLGGFLGLSIISCAGFIIRASLVSSLPGVMRRVIHFTFYLLVLIASINLAIHFFINAGVIEKLNTSYLFIFSEPSHFALVSAPYLFYYSCTTSNRSIFSLVFFLAYTLIIQNLTMLIVTTAAFLMVLNRNKLITKRFIPILITIIVILNFNSFDYFFSRINFTNETTNLSALVYLQGWNNAFSSLIDTFGWGVGFQQFGIYVIPNELSEAIHLQTYGVDLNLLDGGTTGSKILGEFGLFGLAIILFLLIRGHNAFKAIIQSFSYSDFFIFGKCVELAILIEIFVRGVGYFSTNFFLYLIMIFCGTAISKSKKESNEIGLRS